jgi:hypothetical protein
MSNFKRLGYILGLAKRADDMFQPLDEGLGGRAPMYRPGTIRTQDPITNEWVTVQDLASRWVDSPYGKVRQKGNLSTDRVDAIRNSHEELNQAAQEIANERDRLDPQMALTNARLNYATGYDSNRIAQEDADIAKQKKNLGLPVNGNQDRINSQRERLDMLRRGTITEGEWGQYHDLKNQINNNERRLSRPAVSRYREDARQRVLANRKRETELAANRKRLEEQFAGAGIAPSDNPLQRKTNLNAIENARIPVKSGVPNRNITAPKTPVINSMRGQVNKPVAKALTPSRPAYPGGPKKIQPKRPNFRKIVGG